METFLQERSESLVQGLRYGPKEVASLITNARMAQSMSQGPAVGIRPGQARIMKFVLSADAWLHSPTLTSRYTVKDRSADVPLRFLGSLPNVLLRTVRMYISGIPVEISEDYNRVHAMFEECLSKDHKVMEACKGVNLKDPHLSTTGSYADASAPINDPLPTDKCRLYDFIPAAGKAPNTNKLSQVTVTGPLNLGALQTGMMIPLHASPITLELELASTEAEVVQEG